MTLFDQESAREVHPTALNVTRRLCTTCMLVKPIEQFVRNRSKRDGINTKCKDCSLGAMRKLRGVAAGSRKLRPGPDDRCAICDGDGGRRGLFLDHDHATGAFRGWLCGRCNSVIGFALDHPGVLERAIAYLQNERG